MSVTPLQGLPVDSIDNIYIFIADSVRFDAMPRSLIGDGQVYKTVAHALMTAQSVPTMLSGRLPPRHGITWFDYQLPDSYKTLLDLNSEERTTGFTQLRWKDGEFATGLSNVFDFPNTLELDTVEEPFIAIDHDMGGHAPFPHLNGESLEETFTRFSADHSGLRNAYDKAILDSTNEFERRLSMLADQGLLENTLVIYTADHGELLGEHGGFCSHMTPNAPETVYVPTVFHHPDMEKAGPKELPLLQHVDLVPTICDVLGIDWSETIDGESLLNSHIEYDRPAFTSGFMHSPGKFRDSPLDPAYNAPSVWTRHGGIVFNETPIWKRPILVGYDAFFSQYTSAFMSKINPLRRIAATMSMYAPSVKTFGTPAISKSDARDLADEILNNDTLDAKQAELSDKQKENLRDLGYM